ACVADSDCSDIGDGLCRTRGGDGCSELCVIEPDYCCIGRTHCIVSGERDPNNACAVCNPANAKTEWSASGQTHCDDQNICTVSDTCDEDVCQGVPRSCDDKNVCTIDAC